ncbi:sugar ABC transporter ATP-binding protein [Aquabacterium sp.]|uniref:sugar ABC transporter ATP-binding protein n=1 Tax=Aquabacterium sp. TaxID=1872578 RepID=UPI00403781FA
MQDQAPPLPPAQPRLALHQLSKSFGATHALRQVSFSARAGSIHAVTGENGAGKSTLMKLLAGVHQADEGEIRIDGRLVRLATPAQARAAGVSTVFQELTVLPHLSVAENLCLGREPTRAVQLDRPEMARRARAVLAQVGLALDPARPCADLSIGEQQMLEIAKGLATKAEVFIFDEPTAPLNRAEVDQLARVLRALRDSGKLIFYISHRLEEIFRFCDTVTVLKDGQHIDTMPISSLDADKLVSLMVGRPLQALFPPRPAQPLGADTPTRLQARALRVAAHAPLVDLTLRAGEIVGIAGLEGQGQRELMRALSGVHKRDAGEVLVSDEHGRTCCLDARGHVQRAVNQGVALMPEDRKGEGLYLALPIRDNIWLGPLRRTRLWQRARRDAGLVKTLAARMGLSADPGKPVGALSGGNQQKVMLGRWLASGIKTLLVEQPTRGVDVGAKAEIYGLLRQFTQEGGAVLAVSGDLPELLGLCDRILVMRAGRIVADVRAAGATEESLLSLALQEARA